MVQISQDATNYYYFSSVDTQTDKGDFIIEFVPCRGDQSSPSCIIKNFDDLIGFFENWQD